METENYICKKEIDWSTLNDGFTLPYDYQVRFYENMEGYMQRGDIRIIRLYLEGKEHQVKLYNVNNPKEKRNKDCYQLRYSAGSSFALHLRELFIASYNFFSNMRALRVNGDRKRIILPEDKKEYIAIYTTEYADTFVVEPIFAEDIAELKLLVEKKDERTAEAELDNFSKDSTADIVETKRTVKIRKLNKKIGDNLKLLYGYRCQICGRLIGEEFGCSKVVESHHIECFTKSLNNDASNQIIVCPNHHTIIHEVNPVFDRRRKLYLFKNGVEQRLTLNYHL